MSYMHKPCTCRLYEVNNSSDCKEITMSGVEELLDTSSDVTTQGSPVVSTHISADDYLTATKTGTSTKSATYKEL